MWVTNFFLYISFYNFIVFNVTDWLENVTVFKLHNIEEVIKFWSRSEHQKLSFQSFFSFLRMSRDRCIAEENEGYFDGQEFYALQLQFSWIFFKSPQILRKMSSKFEGLWLVNFFQFRRLKPLLFNAISLITLDGSL